MLSRLHLVFLTAVLLLPLTCFAKDTDSSYWEQLKSKLAHISPQKKGPSSTAVGGIRGSKASADTLYWKGEEESVEVAEEEFAHFQEAYQLAVAGHKEVAAAKFAAFLQDFPQSPLASDARQALKELQ